MHQYKLAIKAEDWLNPTSKESARPSQNSEVLFIEQAETYLCDGGYLAIVVPDGILTNSSMQYVRDYIGETFRIVAVISLPQTAFAANGAGVKSSVMFLKKYSKSEKLNRQSIKAKIQTSLLEQSAEGRELFELLENKKKRLSQYAKLIKAAEKNNFDNLEKLKEERQQANDEFDEKIEKAREILAENYGESYKKELNDYSIFMAIAENIGYDATGKETQNNELEDISQELVKFINSIEEGKDRFFL